MNDLARQVEEALAAHDVVVFRKARKARPARACGMCAHQQANHVWPGSYIGPCRSATCRCLRWRSISPVTVLIRFARFTVRRNRPV